MTRLQPHKVEPFTYREYALIPEDGKRHELIEGDFYVTPAPGTTHQSVSLRLLNHLYTQLDETGIARVFTAPTDVLLDDTTCVQPDLIVFRDKKLIQPHALVGIPDLVIEILSPSHPGNDRFLKRGVYARFGIPEYWIVDPVNGFVTVLRMSAPGKYDLEARFDRSKTLTSEEFPEIAVPLTKVFRDT